MKKKRTQTKKRVQRKNPLVIFLSLLILIFAICAFFSLSPQSVSKISSIASNTEKTLQLKTFDVPTPKPTPIVIEDPNIPCVHHDDGHKVNPSCFCPNYLLKCEKLTCITMKDNFSQQPPYYTCEKSLEYKVNWCAPPFAKDGDGYYCIGKPVIYLYPEHPMMVNVSVQTTGEIVVSDPHYPDGGWKNVFAEPSGKLTYQGGTYRELFYESNVKDFKKPTNGITLDQQTLEQDLDKILTRLGLIGSEKQEFLDWWVPRLTALHSPHILFSILETKEKERIDHVVYDPEPDTRIEFIAYFKPLSKPYEGKALTLPKTSPQRVGFTAVEWGGVIDSQ